MLVASSTIYRLRRASERKAIEVNICSCLVERVAFSARSAHRHPSTLCTTSLSLCTTSLSSCTTLLASFSTSLAALDRPRCYCRIRRPPRLAFDASIVLQFAGADRLRCHRPPHLSRSSTSSPSTTSPASLPLTDISIQRCWHHRHHLFRHRLVDPHWRPTLQSTSRSATSLSSAHHIAGVPPSHRPSIDFSIDCVTGYLQ